MLLDATDGVPVQVSQQGAWVVPSVVMVVESATIDATGVLIPQGAHPVCISVAPGSGSSLVLSATSCGQRHVLCCRDNPNGVFSDGFEG
jgi:hypothetical protein